MTPQKELNVKIRPKPVEVKQNQRFKFIRYISLTPGKKYIYIYLHIYIARMVNKYIYFCFCWNFCSWTRDCVKFSPINTEQTNIK